MSEEEVIKAIPKSREEIWDKNLLLVLDSNEYIFAFGILKKPACGALLDQLLDTFPTHSIRIPRLIIEEVGRHLTPEEFREFMGFVTNLTTIDEDFVVPFELGARYELQGLKPADAFIAVKINTLPSLGTLTLDGVAAVAGQLVAVSDITAGKLVYTPLAGATGTPYASLDFQVQDNGSGNSNSVTLLTNQAVIATALNTTQTATAALPTPTYPALQVQGQYLSGTNSWGTFQPGVVTATSTLFGASVTFRRDTWTPWGHLQRALRDGHSRRHLAPLRPPLWPPPTAHSPTWWVSRAWAGPPGKT